MKYAIYSDVDGTIYSHSQTYHKETKSYIKKAQNKNIEFIMCTGNPYFDNMQKMAKELGVDYFVGSNGAFIFDVKSDKELHLNIIDKWEAQELLDIVNERKLGADWWDSETLYANEFILPKVKKNLLNVISSEKRLQIKEKIKHGIHKMEVYTENTPEMITELDLLQVELKDKGFQLARMKPFHLEITKENVSKGDAVKILSKYLGIKLDNVMTIGDSANDHSMFAVTDYSYAMGNADNITKEKANFHTSTVEQNGLGEAIIDFMFRKRLTDNFKNQK